MCGQQYPEHRLSGEIKGCNLCGHPCTARLDGLNHVKLWHNPPDVTADSSEPIQASLHTHTSRIQLQVRITPWNFWYGVDNPGEVGSTAVYPHLEIASTLYLKLLTQPWNNLYLDASACSPLIISLCKCQYIDWSCHPVFRPFLQMGWPAQILWAYN